MLQLKKITNHVSRTRWLYDVTHCGYDESNEYGENSHLNCRNNGGSLVVILAAIRYIGFVRREGILSMAY